MLEAEDIIWVLAAVATRLWPTRLTAKSSAVRRPTNG